MTSFRNQKNDIQKEGEAGAVFQASLFLLGYLLFFFFFIAKTAAPTPATPFAPIAMAIELKKQNMEKLNPAMIE